MLKRVLVVDDSALIRSVAEKAVKEAGCEVVIATNGQEGLEALAKESVDIIFCDVNMPIMGGLEMVEIVKQNDRYRFIPIVMLTTENNQELKDKGKVLGVKAWLLKPFNKDRFLTAFNKLIG